MKDTKTEVCSLAMPSRALTIEPNAPLIAKLGAYTAAKVVVAKVNTDSPNVIEAKM